MLVLEHAGQPLDSSPRLETLDVPSRCDVVDQLLSAVPHLLLAAFECKHRLSSL